MAAFSGYEREIRRIAETCPRKRGNSTELLKEFFRKASTWVVPDNKITVENGTSLLLLQLPSGGSLVLDSDAQRELGRVVTGLYQHFSKPRDEIISERTIEQVVTDALVAAVDSSRKTEGSLDGLIQETVAKVKEKLLSNPVSYACWIPVAGINQYDLPASFAGCRFALFDQQLTDRITSLWADIIGSPMDKDLVSLLLQDPRVRRSCQMIEVPVKALDEHTAFELAEKRARQVIDTLNFFADLIPFSHGRVYLVPWDCTEPRASFSLSEKGDWSVSSEVPGQSIGYGMGFLRLSSYLSDAIARAEELLVHADTLDSFSSVLLSSLLWAGRATTEQNLEEAFLLYAIALETLMLPEGTQHELRFRLALRVACFLGDDYEERRHIVERIKNLYDIRSKIVHSGSFQVSKHEVMSMNSITKQAVLKALVDPRLRACKQRKDAAKWFEERVLGSK